MTEEEAIEFLKGNFYSCPSDCYSSCEKCLEEANERAIEALEKQIPKKPIGDLHSVPHHRCPTCNSAIRLFDNEGYDAFCKFCGTKLDWSDEK